MEKFVNLVDNLIYTDIDGLKDCVVSVDEGVKVLILEVAIPCPHEGVESTELSISDPKL